MIFQRKAFSFNDAVMASIHGPRYCCPFHMHQLAEIAYVIEGEVSVETLGEQTVLKSGDMLFVPPYEPHAYHTDDSCPVKIWLLLFSYSLVSDVLGNDTVINRYHKVAFKPSVELKKFVNNRLIDTGELMVEVDKKELLTIKSLIYPIIDEYMHEVSEVNREGRVRKNSLVDTLKYLYSHFKEEVTLEQVANAIGYSKSEISHTLSKSLSMNFRTLVNSLRVDYAKKLLNAKNCSIKNVSWECGFSCERSFHRVFKAFTRLTPMEYRVRHVLPPHPNAASKFKTEKSEQPAIRKIKI